MKAKSSRRSTETLKPRNLSGVLLDATEAFVSSQRSDPSEKRMFRELAREYLPYADISSRYQVAQLLANSTKTPAELLETLGRDADPDVSGLTLQHADGLSEAYLLAAVENGPQHRRDAISKRVNLPKSVLAALLSREADATLTSFKEQSASKSPSLSANTRCTHTAQQIHTSGIKSFLSLPPVHRLSILQKYEAQAREAEIFNPHGAITTGRLANCNQHELAMTVITGKEGGIEALLREYTSLPSSDITEMLEDKSGHCLLIVLKSLGFEKKYCGWILLHHLGTELKLDTLRELLAHYNGFCEHAAHLILESWANGAEQKSIRHFAMYMDTPGVRERALNRLRKARQQSGTTSAPKMSALN
ncbi:hypothetical protein [Pseudovibrio sp. SPO723]|uniref:hypothetical protein n=1 Tax=Nesiotobacter zosterae TaxID=392721 RepID=UPI0029C46D93|nr:hypothetical protein [Pseudovibrio sp. SPO723]MDX5595603.1 hypothetical protein [Pseudovibrio sp. SPO723]